MLSLLFPWLLQFFPYLHFSIVSFYMMIFYSLYIPELCGLVLSTELNLFGSKSLSCWFGVDPEILFLSCHLTFVVVMVHICHNFKSTNVSPAFEAFQWASEILVSCTMFRYICINMTFGCLKRLPEEDKVVELIACLTSLQIAHHSIFFCQCHHPKRNVHTWDYCPCLKHHVKEPLEGWIFDKCPWIAYLS